MTNGRLAAGVVAISDEQAQAVEKYEYSVYGRVRIMAPNGQTRTASIVANPYYFTGRRLDGETGLYYYRARYYSPEIGRFLQTDPIGYKGGLNLYSYCANNPVILVDPSGLIVWSPMPGTGIYVDTQTGGGSVDPWFSHEYVMQKEREHFPGIADPYYGGYRHALAACLLSRSYGQSIAKVLVGVWDAWAEMTDPDTKIDKYSDMFAEQVGLIAAKGDRCIPCEELALKYYPNSPELEKQYDPQIFTPEDKKIKPRSPENSTTGWSNVPSPK